LVKGSGGVFEVTMDNQVIFSKKQTGRFPMPGEVAAALESRVPNSGT
jgi:selT/selW/selH-like putative selenoprotein